jgi:hypothetical protein
MNAVERMKMPHMRIVNQRALSADMMPEGISRMAVRGLSASKCLSR